ncbi:hypothetical protein RND71_006723 [Anisodus tanguticus]|uniref:Uncharacterized protein n=1 Tax=Anisodus tanguticus TaxID=243964 RepID=A0AAE1VTE7_9SOLA|nr:hypothetical protein RND71_006723 [Anisodus tanguticus]
MAQLDPMHKFSQTSKSTPKSNSPTFEQLLQGNERNWSTSTSPTAYYDQEEYTPTHGKKSVISKVKEKAKKLKHSLSAKKNRHENDVHDDNHTPSWGVTLEDDDDDGDPDYLGAPMYESELAPEPLKEAARQHPRADPVISEEHVLPTSIKREVTEHDQVIEHDNTEKLPDSPSKTITETVTEKLAPAYAAVSDATHAIASKISNLTLTNTDNQESEIQNEPKTGQFADQSNVNKLGENVEQNASGLTSPTQKWDRGVSVKEYFVEKFELGEGERSLSHIITEAMSPRQAASGDIGIVEKKMKGAVTSLIRSDESPKTPENSIKSSASNNPISTSDIRYHPILANDKTRLQKKAPSSLQLDDKMNVDGFKVPFNFMEEASSHCAIPLLSPLIFSTTSQDENAKCNDNINGPAKHMIQGNGPLEKSGWQHPALGTYTEPSTIFALFQSQCTLANSGC